MTFPEASICPVVGLNGQGELRLAEGEGSIVPAAKLDIGHENIWIGHSLNVRNAGL